MVQQMFTSLRRRSATARCFPHQQTRTYRETNDVHVSHLLARLFRVMCIRRTGSCEGCGSSAYH